MEIMFDLETLDTEPTAAVLSVGAVKFDRSGKILDRFYRALHYDRQVRVHGRSVSQATIAWWMEQNTVAREEAFSPVRHHVVDTIQEFNFWCIQDGARPTCFWANDPDFDCTIWGGLCKDFSMGVPWSYKNKGALRTIVRESSLSYEGIEFTPVMGVPHMPVTDCEIQVQVLMAAREKIGRRNLCSA